MRKCFASLSAVLLGLFVLVGSELTRVTVEAAESPRASRGETDVAGDARDLLDRGAAIYANQCASCHGDKGQGVADRYERAFGGTRTLSWLTRRIERTMPEEDPDLCVGEDAAAVAAYLHRMHYAPDAQSKRRTPPPRELHRLTAEQHRQSLADLLMSTSADRDGPSDDRRGLSAAFYRDGKLRGKPIDRRVLPDADLRFTPDHPLAERFDPKGHSLRLTGSLHAPRSGVYEFVIRSDRAVRLWLNDAGTRGGGGGNEFAQVDRAFIDGWVKSEGVDVYRGKMFLLGGRDYPLLLDFSARNQGVQRDVNPNQKDRPETYLSLRWITPGRADERVIESRYLSPMQSPAVFVSGAAFPPEDESRGFERGVGVSPTWLSAATRAASEASVAAAERYDRQAGERANEAPRARVYLEAILSRAVRRPLTDHERANWIEASLDRASSPREAVRSAVKRALLSPAFLYPDASAQTDDPHAIAARLALALTDGLPDVALRRAADDGSIADPLVLATHAKRLADSSRGKAKLRRFFVRWLDLDHASETTKDPDRFPAFDGELLADLRTSLDRSIEGTVFGDASSYTDLLLGETIYVNRRLAEVYRFSLPDPVADAPSADDFVPVPTTDRGRSGLLAHPYLLAALSYRDDTSPIHRGVFLTRGILGLPLNPPPEAFALGDHDFDPEMTMREKVVELTKAPNCMACHDTINPLGFSFEHFDAIGRYRAEDAAGRAIDSQADFIDPDGKTVRFAGPEDVAAYAAQSDRARRAFVRRLYRHATHREPETLGPDTLDKLDRGFVHDQTHIRRLFIKIAVAESRLGIQPTKVTVSDDQSTVPNSIDQGGAP